jgi:hypothetical protein
MPHPVSSTDHPNFLWQISSGQGDETRNGKDLGSAKGQQCEQRDGLISLTRLAHSPAQTTRTAKSSAAVDNCVSCRSG